MIIAGWKRRIFWCVTHKTPTDKYLYLRWKSRMNYVKYDKTYLSMIPYRGSVPLPTSDPGINLVCGEMLPGSVSDFLLIGIRPLSLIIGLKPTKSNSKLEIWYYCNGLNMQKNYQCTFAIPSNIKIKCGSINSNMHCIASRWETERAELIWYSLVMCSY